jgi:hypothetical protein
MTYNDNHSISFNKESGVIDMESSSERRPNYVIFRGLFSYHGQGFLYVMDHKEDRNKETLLYNLNDFKNHGMEHFNEKSGVVVYCGSAASTIPSQWICSDLKKS